MSSYDEIRDLWDSLPSQVKQDVISTVRLAMVGNFVEHFVYESDDEERIDTLLQQSPNTWLEMLAYDYIWDHNLRKRKNPLKAVPKTVLRQLLAAVIISKSKSELSTLASSIAYDVYDQLSFEVMYEHVGDGLLDYITDARRR